MQRVGIFTCLLKAHVRKLDYWLGTDFGVKSSTLKDTRCFLELSFPTLNKIKIASVLVVDIMHKNTCDICGLNVIHQGYAHECM